MASRCRRPNLGPAFDLKVVHDHNPADHTDGNHVANAAACQEMSDILGCLSLGSWRDAIDVEKLRIHGITHVLNVAKEVPPPCERAAMESGDFCHKTIPLMDCHSQNIDTHFEDAFAFIQEAREQNGKVLVHCRRGISRSPAIVVGYLMSQEHYTFQDALDFVKERRSCVSLNLAFREVLSEYTPGKPMHTLSSIRSPAQLPYDKDSAGSLEDCATVAPQSRLDSSAGDDFGLSAPESEKSSQT